jgi:hypothetical protein
MVKIVLYPFFQMSICYKYYKFLIFVRLFCGYNRTCLAVYLFFFGYICGMRQCPCPLRLDDSVHWDLRSNVGGFES